MNPVPLHFDEIQVGVRGRSGGRTLNETDLSFSCMLSGGWHPIHADAEFARTAPSGQRILHGSYCLLIATGWPRTCRTWGTACWLILACVTGDTNCQWLSEIPCMPMLK